MFVSLGLFTFAFSTFLAISSYTPLPIWDQWQFYFELVRNAGGYPLSSLWAQHNEHRPVLLRLLCLTDYAWFSGTNVFLYTCLIGGHVADVALLVWMARRYAGWRGERLWMWAGLVLTLLFGPAQRENFTWAWQVCFITFLLATTAAVAALLVHTEQWRARRTAWTAALAAALICGALAWLSLASGLVAAVLLAVLAWWLRLPRANLLLFIGAAVLPPLLYFANYQAPAQHINPAVALTQHLDRVIPFFLAYMGGLTGLGIGKSALLPEITGTLGLAFWAWAVWQSVRARIHGEATPLFPSAMLFFTLMALATAATTSTARIVLTGEQPIVSRYQSIAVFFWLGLAGFALDRWRTRPRLCHGIAYAALALAFFPFVTAPELLREEVWREEIRSRAAMAVASDVDEKEIFAVILPHGGDWWPWRTFAERLQLSLFHNPYFRLHEAPVTVLPYPAEPLRTCAGSYDLHSIQVVGYHPPGIFFTGWAWDQDQKRPLRDLLVLDEHNRIAGYAQTTMPRPDVPRAIPAVTDERVGWQGYAPYSLAGKAIHVVGLENGSVTCRLGPDLTLTPAP